MTRSIDELSSFFDNKVIEVLKENKYSEIWDDQWECIQKCLVERKNVFIGLPTGSGKTFPALISIIDTVLKKRGKAIYIVPLRALARQKYEQFNRILAPLGISVGITTGDYAKGEYTNIGRKDVIIATIEKVDSLIRHNEEWLYDVSLFVIDEIQMVEDISRGLTLEIVVSEIIRKFKNAQRIALSAVIGNPEEIKNWLADDIIFNKKRIIPLYAGILTYFGLLQIRKEKLQIPIRKNVYTVNKRSMDKWKWVRYGNTIDLVKYFLNQGKQCIIFTNARDHAENLAISLAIDVKHGGYAIDEISCGEIAQLIEDSFEEKTKFSKKLIDCVRLGVSFHHAGLQLIQRDIIEKNFENKNLKVLVSTPTLEQGVNLPANVVIISDYLRWNGHDYDPQPTNNVLNMMGRAGRPGHHKFGEAILVEDQSVNGQLYGKYIVKTPERVLSQLRVARTRQKHLNGLIASNRIIPIEEIFEYLKTTLWFTIYRYEFEEFDLRKEIFKDLSYLEDNGFIKKSGSYYIPTKFGKAVSDSCIDCETGLLFLRGVKKILTNMYTEKDLDNPWPIFQLLLLSPEVTSYRPYDNNFEGLEIASKLKAKDLLLSKMPDNEEDMEKQRYSRQSLAASLLCNWMEEKPLEEIISKYPELRDADFYELGDMVEWLGDALVKIATLNGVSKGITDKILIYCDRVVGGVKEELLEYIRIEGVRRKSARKLFNAGFTYNSLKDLDHNVLSKLVGPFVSKKIRDYFERVEKEGGESIFREEQIYEEIDEILSLTDFTIF
jgi:helicase